MKRDLFLVCVQPPPPLKNMIFPEGRGRSYTGCSFSNATKTFYHVSSDKERKYKSKDRYNVGKILEGVLIFRLAKPAFFRY